MARKQYPKKWNHWRKGHELHTVKSVEPFFTDTWYSIKLFDVRPNDRGYQVGDLLLQKQYDPVQDSYSGRFILARITYVAGPQQHIPLHEDFVILGLKILELGRDTSGIYLPPLQPNHL